MCFFSCHTVTYIHPLANGNNLIVSYIKYMILRVQPYNAVDALTQIMNMEKTEVSYCHPVEDKRSCPAWHSQKQKPPGIHYSSDRTDTAASEYRLRNPFEKFLLCLDLVSSIVSPVPIRSYLHRFLKGLRQMLRIHCAGADENIISKLSQTINQIRDILPVISVDVQNHIKKINS